MKKSVLILGFILLVSIFGSFNFIDAGADCDSSGCGGVDYHCCSTRGDSDCRFRIGYCGGGWGEMLYWGCHPSCAEPGCSCYPIPPAPPCDSTCYYSNECVTSGSSGCGACSRSTNGNVCDSTSGTCQSGACIPNTQIGTLYWTNLKGNLLSATQIGDTVRMVAGGSGFGNEINYTVYKNSTFLWIFKTIKTISPTSSSDLWIPNETVNGAFFKAKIGSVENASSTIDIVSLDNRLPFVNITFPQKGYLTSVNYPINFAQSSYDEDDLLMLNWSFGDNSANQIIINYSFVDKSTNFTLGDAIHNYSIPGRYDITLSATEMGRGQTHSDSLRIYVLKSGVNVMPIISQPADGISIGNLRIVEFNASGSYVANCTKGVITNLAFSAGDLNCSYIHVPGAKIYSSNNYNITMNWTLTTSGSSEVITRTGDFVSMYNSTVIFTETFETGGTHTAFLDMIYESR